MPLAVLTDYSQVGRQIADNPPGRKGYQWRRFQGGQLLTLWLHNTPDGFFLQLSESPIKTRPRFGSVNRYVLPSTKARVAWPTCSGMISTRSSRCW